MTINSVGAFQWGNQPSGPTGPDSSHFKDFSAFGESSSAVTAHQFGPNDKLNKYLTLDDRATILSSTGVDVRPDGTVMVSLQAMQSRSVNDTVAIMDSIGQTAADRATGKLTGPISSDYLTQMIKQFSSQLAANQDPFAT